MGAQSPNGDAIAIKENVEMNVSVYVPAERGVKRRLRLLYALLVSILPTDLPSLENLYRGISHNFFGKKGSEVAQKGARRHCKHKEDGRSTCTVDLDLARSTDSVLNLSRNVHVDLPLPDREIKEHISPEVYVKNYIARSSSSSSSMA